MESVRRIQPLKSFHSDFGGLYKLYKGLSVAFKAVSEKKKTEYTCRSDDTCSREFLEILNRTLNSPLDNT